MLKKLMFIGLYSVFAFLVTGVPVHAVDEKELEKQSELIAKLLVSCRAIIAQNQDLFNDPVKGDKGFTGDVYVSKVKEHFKKVTGIEVSESDASSTDPLKKALGNLLVSTKDVIDESQKVLNIRGLGFKNVIPAIVGRRAGYKYKKAMGSGYYLKQTSMEYRNPVNMPDTFESNIFKRFKEPGHPKDKGIGETITYSDGFKVYRYMLPLYIEPACLQCHGEPKGEKDITGRIKEGYKEGELRGAISVMVPYP
jgi:general secretion pathway protein A